MKVYLGDGVYAESEDSGMIKVTTEIGFPQPTNTVYLEPEVFVKLVSFAKEAMGWTAEVTR